MSKTWYAPSDPASIKPVPWLSQDAIAYLESILTPDMHVAEFGGGGSTLWFAERVKYVETCEPNLQWRLAIGELAGENVMIYDGSMPGMEISVPFDLLFIDGEPIEQRGAWLMYARNIVKPGGWVVLDNANRPEYAKEREWLQVIAELKFTSKLQGAHLVTEFYKVK